MNDERRVAGFKQYTRLAAARRTLLDLTTSIDRTETIPVSDADERVLAKTISAPRSHPQYDRVEQDGYAVRAADTFGSSVQSPTVFQIGEAVGPEVAHRVAAGDELPDNADAVVTIEHTNEIEGALAVLDAITAGENVSSVGAGVAANTTLFECHHKLRPSDLGLLRAVGVDSVTVVSRPVIEIIPTGEDIVDSNPGPGEARETSGFTTSRYVKKWGGVTHLRDPVSDTDTPLRTAIERGLDADIVVTIGGSSIGEYDIVPDVVSDCGTLQVHGIAIEPGSSAGIGLVEGTPILLLPGPPVSCLVNTIQLLRPTVKRLADQETTQHPSTRAQLGRKVSSEPGVRTFVRVQLESADYSYEALPVKPSAGFLSSGTQADGWITIPEQHEGIPAGQDVTVEDWEWSP